MADCPVTPTACARATGVVTATDAGFRDRAGTLATTAFTISPARQGARMRLRARPGDRLRLTTFTPTTDAPTPTATGIHSTRLEISANAPARARLTTGFASAAELHLTAVTLTWTVGRTGILNLRFAAH